MIPRLSVRNLVMNILGSIVLAFGLYHIHAVSVITEGGTLGMTLLLDHWFSVSPAVSGFVMNLACYFFGWRVLGKRFIACSIISTSGFSVTYALCELFPPFWPRLASMPLCASILGALFVGVGVGLCVRAGGAPSGDDALAMGISTLFDIPIQRIYLVTDLMVLLLSLTYIPLTRIAYSLVTVVLSGQIIGLIQRKV